VITYIVPTIDVESAPGLTEVKDPLSQLIYGTTEQGEYGIRFIMNAFEKYGFNATFFVSVFEIGIYGVKPIERVVRSIHERGFDVELHTHPNFLWYKKQIFPKKGKFMWEYTLEEQVRLLRFGKALINRWIKEKIVAHRAGGYGADYNTLKAINGAGIPLDSSMFYGKGYYQKNCKLNNPVLTINKLKRFENVWEVPITVYKLRKPIKHIPFIKTTIYKKIDVNWASTNELINAIRLCIKLGVNPITLFLHSFSFTGKYGKLDVSTIKRFLTILDWLSKQQNVKVISIRNLLNLPLNKLAVGSNIMPVIDESNHE